MNKRNKVYYGGAFDPITLSHEAIIAELHDLFGDKLVVGVTEHDYKKSWKPLAWRKTVVQNICCKYQIDIANPCEVDGETYYESEIIDTIRVVEQKERTYKFLSSHPELGIGTIVIGNDEWIDLNNGKWHYADKLLEEYKFLVVPRPKTNIVSSTLVHKLIAEGADRETLLKYISESVYCCIAYNELDDNGKPTVGTIENQIDKNNKDNNNRRTIMNPNKLEKAPLEQKKLHVCVDMQNDFIDMALGSPRPRLSSLASPSI